jgi:alanyl-tRNA synthetase
MGQDEGQERSHLTTEEEKSPAQLRSEIEEVREDLGDTAAALAAKTDVKTRAREKAEEIKQSAAVKKDELLSKTGRSPTGGNGSGKGVAAGASSAATRVTSTAKSNPVPTAALGAVIGGFLLGRLTRRDR